jgi:hypothetical protein
MPKNTPNCSLALLEFWWEGERGDLVPVSQSVQINWRTVTRFSNLNPLGEKADVYNSPPPPHPSTQMRKASALQCENFNEQFRRFSHFFVPPALNDKMDDKLMFTYK